MFMSTFTKYFSIGVALATANKATMTLGNLGDWGHQSWEEIGFIPIGDIQMNKNFDGGNIGKPFYPSAEISCTKWYSFTRGHGYRFINEKFPPPHLGLVPWSYKTADTDIIT